MGAWINSLRRISSSGSRFIDNEGRECVELTNFFVVVDSLDDIRRPLQWVRSNGNWIYPSDDELRDMLFIRDLEELRSYSYGNRLFSFRGRLDQIDGFIIPLLRSSPQSRRALAVVADPVADDVTNSPNFVSLISLWFRIIDGSLSVSAVLRSSDFFLGWPANIFQVSMIQSYVAEKLGLPAGSITTISLSAHFFGDDERFVKKLIS